MIVSGLVCSASSRADFDDVEFVIFDRELDGHQTSYFWFLGQFNESTPAAPAVLRSRTSESLG